MSLKPGIGALWFDKFHEDVYPHDRVVVNGVEEKPPRYYDMRLKRWNKPMLERLKLARVEAAKERASENTPERLDVREQVTRARVNRFKRS